MKVFVVIFILAEVAAIAKPFDSGILSAICHTIAFFVGIFLLACLVDGNFKKSMFGEK